MDIEPPKVYSGPVQRLGDDPRPPVHDAQQHGSVGIAHQLRVGVDKRVRRICFFEAETHRSWPRRQNPLVPELTTDLYVMPPYLLGDLGLQVPGRGFLEPEAVPTEPRARFAANIQSRIVNCGQFFQIDLVPWIPWPKLRQTVLANLGGFGLKRVGDLGPGPAEVEHRGRVDRPNNVSRGLDRVSLAAGNALRG